MNIKYKAKIVCALLVSSLFLTACGDSETKATSLKDGLYTGAQIINNLESDQKEPLLTFTEVSSINFTSSDYLYNYTLDLGSPVRIVDTDYMYYYLLADGREYTVTSEGPQAAKDNGETWQTSRAADAQGYWYLKPSYTPIYSDELGVIYDASRPYNSRGVEFLDEEGEEIPFEDREVDLQVYGPIPADVISLESFDVTHDTHIINNPTGKIVYQRFFGYYETALEHILRKANPLFNTGNVVFFETSDYVYFERDNMALAIEQYNFNTNIIYSAVGADECARVLASLIHNKQERMSDDGQSTNETTGNG